MVWDHFRGGGPAFGREVGADRGLGGQKVIKGNTRWGFRLNPPARTLHAGGQGRRNRAGGVQGDELWRGGVVR